MAKYLIIINLLFLFVGCGAKPSLDSSEDIPSWYTKQVYISEGFEYYGYGGGSSKSEAVAFAKTEIAKSLSSNIKSRVDYQTNITDNEISKKQYISTTEQTDITISDIEIVEQEKVGNKWFVAVQFLNLPLEKKFAYYHKSFDCNETANQNSYLNKTLLISRINQELKCTPSISLRRNANIWNLVTTDIIIPLYQNDFHKLYIDEENPKLSFKANRKNIEDGDSFFFTLKSEEEGYLSLINVYGYGQVSVLMENHKIKAGRVYQFPDNFIKQDLIASILEEGKSSKEMYIAVVSEKKLNLGRMSFASDTIQTDSGTYLFDELASVLDQRSFSAKIININAR